MIKKILNCRTGCKDIWNAFMVKGAIFGKHDIPYSPTTATVLPQKMITWQECKAIHKQHIKAKKYNYRYDAFVNFYLDDYKFAGKNGIWFNPKAVYNIICHFKGVITPDFSTYQDFPEPIKVFATYCMRAYGYWLGTKGIQIINNVRWGTEETYKYCFEGLPTNSILAIGTVGGGPNKLCDRVRFEKGLYKLVELLSPHTILVYGSARGKCFAELRALGIKIISYQSKTTKAFAKGKKNE